EGAGERRAPDGGPHRGDLRHERTDVASQTRDRAPTGLDEPCGVGPARDRLEPEGSGAGEEVEHRRTREIDPGVDRAEERLTDTVGGGAGARRRGRQRPAPETTGDDAGHDVSSRSGPE